MIATVQGLSKFGRFVFRINDCKAFRPELGLLFSSISFSRLTILNRVRYLKRFHPQFGWVSVDLLSVDFFLKKKPVPSVGHLSPCHLAEATLASSARREKARDDDVVDDATINQPRKTRRRRHISHGQRWKSTPAGQKTLRALKWKIMLSMYFFFKGESGGPPLAHSHDQENAIARWCRHRNSVARNRKREREREREREIRKSRKSDRYRADADADAVRLRGDRNRQKKQKNKKVRYQAQTWGLPRRRFERSPAKSGDRK